MGWVLGLGGGWMTRVPNAQRRNAELDCELERCSKSIKKTGIAFYFTGILAYLVVLNLL